MTNQIDRRRLTIQGTVQGVGFRPFVYRLASELQLAGWVINSPQGVVIEIEAAPALLDAFVTRLQSELPPHAGITELVTQIIPTQGETTFEIHHSEHSGAKSALMLPDLATCPDCLHDITDPANRRYRYPFTNCTNCGPRFSIILGLPYDRPNTTMRGFEMCPECRAEYENPLDRRFHAQPNACPKCGPQLALWDSTGQTLAVRDEALRAAGDALRAGKILALKGLGGFQLLVYARSTEAVSRLRTRKNRYEKPLAVMFPSLQAAKSSNEMNALEERLLTASEAPIVLLRYRGHEIGEIAPEVAPGNPYLGSMLPYTPLHHLLLSDLGFPVVATSGNLSGEPICTDEDDALARLQNIADVFLVHDRPIARHMDDSVVSVAAGELLMLRRARGYVPQPVDVPNPDGRTILAVGGHQKNTVALLHQNHVFTSQHLGDMDSVRTVEVFRQTLNDFQTLYDITPREIACDLHPDYATTRIAEQVAAASGLPLMRIQHHDAHVLSCMAEHHLEGPVLGVSWDGTGYGIDHTVWGGEFLRVDADGFERVAHLRPFPLPGGDAASREPRRSLLGLMYAIYGSDLLYTSDLPCERLDFSDSELRLLLSALDKRLNSPMTSSMGRLFDAVAALAGLHQKSSFEGQAAMALEYAAHAAFASDMTNAEECYPIEITPVTNDQGAFRGIIEWKPMMTEMLHEHDSSVASAKFHNTLAALIVEVAQQVGIPDIVLTGGCFQNRLLLEKTIQSLRSAGFTPYWQQRIPPNDGGIALGQIAAALREGSHVFSSSGQTHQHSR